MKVKKFIKRLLVLLVILGGLWVALNFKHIRSFPGIISAFYAKEFCSCYFVSKMGEPYCTNYARQWVPTSSFKLDTDKKSVTVSGLGVTTTAVYRSPKIGCGFAEK